MNVLGHQLRNSFHNEGLGLLPSRGMKNILKWLVSPRQLCPEVLSISSGLHCLAALCKLQPQAAVVSISFHLTFMSDSPWIYAVKLALFFHFKSKTSSPSTPKGGELTPPTACFGIWIFSLMYNSSFLFCLWPMKMFILSKVLFFFFLNLSLTILQCKRGSINDRICISVSGLIFNYTFYQSFAKLIDKGNPTTFK